MNDKLGRELKAGQRVAYATRDSCWAYLHIGKVLGPPKNGSHGVRVQREGKNWRGNEMKPTTLTIPDRVLIIQEAP